LDKAPDAFRTISEVADEINVPQHVLRFWESRFAQIRPLKRGGGRRYYRPQDIDLLRGVRHLLYGEGYTIRGVQRILREQGLAYVQNVWRAGAESPAPQQSDEDKADEVAPPAAAAVEPEAALFGGVPLAAPRGEQTPSRREPALRTPGAAASEDRRTLQATLDDLIACRRLLDAALAATSAAED